MPWIQVDEPFSAPPRTTGPLSPPGADAVVDLEDRWGSVLEAELTGLIDASGCERLELRGSVLRGVSIRADEGLELDIANCSFIDCDLTAIRFGTVTNTDFAGCKLSGIDLGSATLRDVTLDRTLLRLTNARMAELERVAFVGCTLDDVEFADAELNDVAFPGSDLRAMEFDKARFARVDLREAQELDLRSGRRFDGCLIGVDQVAALAHVFAHAAGIGLERDPADRP